MKTVIEDVRMIENVTVGHSEQEIVICINKQDKGYENIYAIPADKLKDLVMVLFTAGLTFQEERNVDIGFGSEGDE